MITSYPWDVLFTKVLDKKKTGDKKNRKMIIDKLYGNKYYKYNTLTGKYLNPITMKWVVRPRDNRKKSIGKSIGKSISKAISYVNSEFIIFDYRLDYFTDEESNIRLNFFLRKVIEKYSNYLHRKENDNLFDMDNEDLSYISSYFSFNDIKTILRMGEYKFIINKLINDGYIEQKSIRNPKDATKYLYTFIPQDKLLNIIPIKKKNVLLPLRVYNSIVTYYRRIEKKLGDYSYIFHQLKTVKINIRKEEYILIIKNNYNDYKLEKIDNKRKYLSKEEYIKDGLVRFNMIENYNKLSAYERIEFCNRDNFSGRFHSIFSSIPSEVRHDYIKGYDTEIDLKQSQLTFLAKLLLDEIGENTFTTDVNNNDLYLLFMKEFNKLNRKSSKTFMFSILFGEIWKENKNGKKYVNRKHILFEKMYNKAGRYIFKLKNTPNNLNKQHSILAKKLQELEVECFSEIWKQLKQNKIKFIPIHDSVMVNNKDKELTIKIMNEVLTEKLKGVNYKLNIK